MEQRYNFRGSTLAPSPPPRYLPVTESSVALPPKPKAKHHDHPATTLPHVPNANHVGAGYPRPYWLRHPDVRMPCVRSRPSDCGRPTNRPDEVPQNERMASWTTASADVKAASLAASFYHVAFCAGFRMPGWRDYPHAPVAGVRKAPRHEIAGCGRQRCRGCYGDLATSSGAPVMTRSGSEPRFATSAERRLKHDRAAGVLSGEVLYLLVVIAQQFGVARQAVALSGQSQHRR
jgi:hypothetical protein